jgi:hypothetical protein
MKVSLAEAEATVASLRARVAEYDAQYRRSLDVMRTAPQIEAELAQLNRDYDVHKKNYEALVGRRESASLTGELESTAGVADFRLIDPPRASTTPVAPNRMLLLPGALLIDLPPASVLVLSPASCGRCSSMGVLREVTGLRARCGIETERRQGDGAPETPDKTVLLGFSGSSPSTLRHPCLCLDGRMA